MIGNASDHMNDWQPPVSLGQMLEGPERFSIFDLISDHHHIKRYVQKSSHGAASCSHVSTSPLRSRTHVFHGCVNGMWSHDCLKDLRKENARVPFANRSQCHEHRPNHLRSQRCNEESLCYVFVGACCCKLERDIIIYYHLFVFLGFESSSTCSCRLQQSKNYNMACVFW